MTKADMNFLKIIRKFFHNYIIKVSSPHKYKKSFVCVNINMINLSLDELRLIAQNKNIRDYENKSEKDLIKALSEPKRKIRINDMRIYHPQNILI